MTAFNAGTWLVHRHAREGRGSRAAVRGSDTLTHAGLAEPVGTITAGLRPLGLRRDDRVLFVTNDDVPMLAAFCGGFVAAVHDVRHLVGDGDSALGAPAGLPSWTWAELLKAGAGESREPAVTQEDSWALWLYTPGITGAMHRHAGIRHVGQTYGDQVLGISPDDAYVRSPDGLYTCLGRGNDPIKAGGTRVSPAEAENRLPQHPNVAQAAVAGLADEHGLDLEQLPTTATGKIQRFRVRELIAQEKLT